MQLQTETWQVQKVLPTEPRLATDERSAKTGFSQFVKNSPILDIWDIGDWGKNLGKNCKILTRGNAFLCNLMWGPSS